MILQQDSSSTQTKTNGECGWFGNGLLLWPCPAPRQRARQVEAQGDTDESGLWPESLVEA